jgi:ribosomal protein S18 acetylase RimI-like enzyme
VFAHNTAAIALYRKHGFAEDGRRARHYRRATSPPGYPTDLS